MAISTRLRAAGLVCTLARGADVNDVLVNTPGCALGYAIVRWTAGTGLLEGVVRRWALPGSALAAEPRVRVAA